MTSQPPTDAPTSPRHGQRPEEPFDFERAFYVKLGAAGSWAPDSIARGLLRLGWSAVPLTEIHAGDWDVVRARLEQEHSHKATVTADTRRLKDLADSTRADVWITFHDSHLFWCRLADGPIEEDSVSKFRRVRGGWRNTDLNGHPLLANQIPGQIAKVQGFRATVCSVRERDILRRLLAGEPSDAFIEIDAARAALVGAVAQALRNLHWRDFETLVDLVFQQAGWRRRSVLGTSMKYVDLELEEPITRELYQVQVKAGADVAEFEQYAELFAGGAFRRLYFVVHSPSPALAAVKPERENVELVLPERLASLVVDHGLTGWLLDRVR